MKGIVLSIFFLVLLVGCSKVIIPSYETFKEQNDWFVETKNSPKSHPRYYHRQNYSDSEYIYIYNDLEDDEGDYEKCIWGFIVDKNDPHQMAKSWLIISGKKFCKERQNYTIFAG